MVRLRLERRPTSVRRWPRSFSEISTSAARQKKRDGGLSRHLKGRLTLSHLLERYAAVKLNLPASYRGACDLRGLTRANRIISWLSEASVV
jgi:hypothetical protein